MMNVQQTQIRNFGIVGHGTCGKTILSEGMLRCAGAVSRMGKIEDGSTVSDYREDEISRQISISTTLLNCDWKEAKLNMLDVPGFLDFAGEVKSSLRVSDFTVIVVHGVTGPEAGTEIAFKSANDENIPKLIVVNMMDKENTNFDSILNQMKSNYSKKILPLMLPVNPGPGFNQILDVLRKKLLTFKTDSSGKFEEGDVPENFKDQVDQLHEELIECIAESDDTMMEKFFEQGGLSEEELRLGMRDAIKNESVIPLFCTSASTLAGVPRVMDFISKYCPSPTDTEKVSAFKVNSEEEIEIDANPSDPESVLVFKTVSEPHVGELSFVRVYSGTVKSGMDMKNTTRNTNERLGQVFYMNGKTRKETGKLVSGDIGAVVKLKNTHTGDTLCNPKLGITLSEIKYPFPNIAEAIHPKSKGDDERMSVGLTSLHEEDPTFIINVDPELRQTTISGQGELQLENMVTKLKTKHRVDVELSKPRIAFRETIRGNGDSKYRHKKQSGGAGQFAEVWMRIEPMERGEGIDFSDSLKGQNVDRVFVPSVEKGVMAACNDGIVAGCHVVDIKIDFYDGKQHPVDSKDIAFQTAGREAFKESFHSAQPCLLEPISEVEVKIPETDMGDVMGDISGRRGKILGMDTESGYQIIRANIPQANLYHYATTLRSITGGRSMHTEKFSHYEEMPRDLEAKVIDKYKRQREEQHS
ncbi:MAG: elongation factor G [Euryarchaeota archaeon]|nr:elongation factor G [Euryarchaeota archaeon]